MDRQFQEQLLRTQITYLRESVEAFLTTVRVSQEERKGIEVFRDYQIEQIEKMLEKLNTR